MNNDEVLAGKNIFRKNVWGVILAITLILLAAFFFAKYATKKPLFNLDGFASCLADKKITMYGAEWCPHCQEEKKEFGDSFRLVPYVECPKDPKLCLERGIEGYPTWILMDGTKLVGKQGLQKLSERSGCILPADPR